ncbi:hypothetical protein C8Q74DRAFT_201009 [Fomes fomentarius]|nr:hypothetical protein C8Q74DRAFT_201009 [Fomes fomentarius]
MRHRYHGPSFHGIVYQPVSNEVQCPTSILVLFQVTPTQATLPLCELFQPDVEGSNLEAGLLSGQSSVRAPPPYMFIYLAAVCPLAMLFNLNHGVSVINPSYFCIQYAVGWVVCTQALLLPVYGHFHYMRIFR